jgi:hypothetical protein
MIVVFRGAHMIKEEYLFYSQFVFTHSPLITFKDIFIGFSPSFTLEGSCSSVNLSTPSPVGMFRPDAQSH